MRFTRSFVVLAAAIAGLSASASAQTKPLSLDDAQAMAQAAADTCHAAGLKVTVVIVDSLGKPKFILREDFKGPSTFETAQLKAYTAMLFSRPSGQNLPAGGLGHYTPTVTPGVTRSRGGVPVIVGGITIGAIGVAGAHQGDHDEICALAGLTKVAEKLGAKTFTLQPPLVGGSTEE